MTFTITEKRNEYGVFFIAKCTHVGCNWERSSESSSTTEFNAQQHQKRHLRITRKSTRILKQADGWMWCETGRKFKTAVQAIAAVKRTDKRTAEQGLTVINTITWEPTTDVGRMVTKALT